MTVGDAGAAGVRLAPAASPPAALASKTAAAAIDRGPPTDRIQVAMAILPSSRNERGSRSFTSAGDRDIDALRRTTVAGAARSRGAPAKRGERARLRFRLGQLGRGARVGDDSAAHRQRQAIAAYERGTDRDREIEIARGAEPPGRAGVRAAPHRLELLDDLHRALLGRASDRAARE